MNEDFNLPVGSIGKVVVLSDTDVHYGYNEDSEVVGKVSKGEYYVYKAVNNHYLIDSHQWIVDGEHLVFTDKGIVEPISDNEEVEEIKEIETTIPEKIIEDSEGVVSKEDETQDIPTYDENEANKPTDNLFKRIGKIFSKRT